MRGCSGGVRGCSGGVCVVAPGGVCVVALGGHVWLLGGVCVVALGGVHGCSQGGVRGCSGGVCVVARGGVHGFFDEIRSMSGRYASYWNAFLYSKYSRSLLTTSSVTMSPRLQRADFFSQKRTVVTSTCYNEQIFVSKITRYKREQCNGKSFSIFTGRNEVVAKNNIFTPVCHSFCSQGGVLSPGGCT